MRPPTIIYDDDPDLGCKVREAEEREEEVVIALRVRGNSILSSSEDALPEQVPGARPNPNKDHGGPE